MHGCGGRANLAWQQRERQRKDKGQHTDTRTRDTRRLYQRRLERNRIELYGFIGGSPGEEPHLLQRVKAAVSPKSLKIQLSLHTTSRHSNTSGKLCRTPSPNKQTHSPTQGFCSLARSRIVRLYRACAHACTRAARAAASTAAGHSDSGSRRWWRRPAKAAAAAAAARATTAAAKASATR